MNPKLIGMKLRTLRGNLTQQEVANSLGISLSAVAMYESGQRIPRDEVKVKFADYYGVSVESIFFAKE